MESVNKEHIAHILTTHISSDPAATADALRELWMQFTPKSIAVIKAEQRAEQETLGIPVPILKTIGKEIAKAARKRVDDFLPLTQALWDNYGREGRVVVVHILGPMELAEPEKLVPRIIQMCRTCITWEDADQLAMYALEPIVRKKPEMWLSTIEEHIEDENKWLRRACITVAGRLAMRNGMYTPHCLALAETLLLDEETDVKRAVSFAIRLSARGNVTPVYDFLTQHVPPTNPAATWVLCDAIRSMATKLLPDFTQLLPQYEQWITDTTLSPKERRSIESAIKTLKKYL